MRHVWIVVIFVMLYGCKDIYEPDIDQVANHLVVEGLITDQPGPHQVRLSRSSSFGSSFQRISVSRAKVWITSSSGLEIPLTEGITGYYHTPASFAGSPGLTYELHIETRNGLYYRSTPQLLMPPLSVDDVDAEHTVKLFFLPSSVSSALTQKAVHGGKILYSITGSERPKFRFDSFLLLDYVIQYGDVMPTYDFCWIRRSITDYLDRDVGESPGSGNGMRHQVGFIPSIAQNLPDIGFPNHTSGPPNTYYYYGSFRIILNYLYALNDEAFHFHDMRNKQLSDEGRFFDPIAAQLPGNIASMTDPDEVVFGFFEASSVTYTPVRVRISPHDITTELVNLTDTMAATGCVFEKTPDFFTNLK